MLADRLHERALGLDRFCLQLIGDYYDAYEAGYDDGYDNGYGDAAHYYAFCCRYGSDIGRPADSLTGLFLYHALAGSLDRLTESPGSQQNSAFTWEPWPTREPYALEVSRWWPGDEPVPEPEVIEVPVNPWPPQVVDLTATGGRLDFFI